MSGLGFVGNAAENPDNVLEQAKGEYEDVIVIGWNKSGRLESRSSLGLTAEQMHWMVSQFQYNLLMTGRTHED